MRRRFLAALAGAPLWGAGEPLPNIVLMMADDLGYGDLASYGAPDVKTPHIDSIGEDGLRFKQFYAMPECTPARTALLTGQYPQRIGGLECAIGVGNVGRYDEAEWLSQRGELGLPRDVPTLAGQLKDVGYRTACIGKWHLGYTTEFSPLRHGFEEYFGIIGGTANYFTHREQDGRPVLYRNEELIEKRGYMTDLIGDEAVRFLEKADNRPYFLYVAFTAPHTPVQGPGDDADIAAADWNRGSRSTYTRMIERMDYQVGRILDEIAVGGRGNHTIVIFLSDNGGFYPLGRNAPLRGAKSSVWEGGIRVPCMIRWPGVAAPGTETDQVALIQDLPVTLLKAAGADLPGQRFDGADLRQILEKPDATAPRRAFWRYKRAEVVRKAARDGDWKYIVDPKETALYNLREDPGEEQDQKAASPERLKQMQALLAGWEQDVVAPRLAGFHRDQ